MITVTAISFAVSFSALVVSLLAWDAFKRYLAQRERERVAIEQLAKLEADFAEHRAAYKNVMIDWKRRVDGLEADLKQFREHVTTEVGGARAQLQSQQSRGYNR